MIQRATRETLRASAQLCRTARVSKFCAGAPAYRRALIFDGGIDWHKGSKMASSIAETSGVCKDAFYKVYTCLHKGIMHELKQSVTV